VTDFAYSTGIRFCFGAVAAIVVADCSAGSQAPSDPSQAVPASGRAAVSRSFSPVASRPASWSPSQIARGKSWMKPNLGRQALMYVSNSNNGTVSVYAYNGGQSPSLVGTLTGFEYPATVCSDKNGNVYIGDFDTWTIYEYAHGGTTPIKTLDNNLSDATGCSVDPTTGNLAVVNYSSGIGNKNGNVAIYTNATGEPTYYQDATQTLT
jgi:hypothetical protein